MRDSIRAMRAPLFAILCGLTATVAAPQPVQREKVSVKIIKVERVEDDEGGALWYTYRLVMRDGVRLYHAHARCSEASMQADIKTSPASCGRVFLPRAGSTYTVDFIPGFGFQFAPQSLYEFDSEEVSDCKAVESPSPHSRN